MNTTPTTLAALAAVAALVVAGCPGVAFSLFGFIAQTKGATQ